MDRDKFFEDALNESLTVKKTFWVNEKEAFFRAGELLVECVRNKKKVLIFGNGGSACDALHFSGEWVNRYNLEREGLPCIALTADTPLITCISNDYSFERVFERQVQALGQEGDVVIGISTSGNSANVIRALEYAGKNKIKRIALLGGSGGKILSQKLSEVSLLVGASSHTPRIQESHGWILHSLCDYVEKALFEK